MIRREIDYRKRTVERMCGGDGSFYISDILLPEEMHGKGRLFARGSLKPGDSVGYHVHENDMEICFFLAGTGVVRDETGSITKVGPGDCNIVDVGEGHEIRNTGDKDLTYVAVILFK